MPWIPGIAIAVLLLLPLTPVPGEQAFWLGPETLYQGDPPKQPGAPYLLTDANRQWLFLHEYDTPYKGVYVRHRVLPAGAWGDRILVTPQTSHEHALLTRDGTIFVTSELHRVYITKSTNGGLNWTLSTIVPTGCQADEGQPTLVEGPRGELGLIWQCYDWFSIMWSQDQAQTWEPRVDVTTPGGPREHDSRAFSDSEGWLWLTYRQEDGSYGSLDWDIAVTHSEDGGRTWSPPRIVDAEGRDALGEPTIGESWDGTLWIFYASYWESGGCCNPTELRYVYSKDRGENWSQPIRFTEDEGWDVNPEIVPGHVGETYLTWVRADADHDVGAVMRSLLVAPPAP